MLKLNEIYLNDSDSDKLSDLLETYNKGLPYKEKKTFQQYAEELLKDAIYFKWKLMKTTD